MKAFLFLAIFAQVSLGQEFPEFPFPNPNPNPSSTQVAPPSTSSSSSLPSTTTTTSLPSTTTTTLLTTLPTVTRTTTTTTTTTTTPSATPSSQPANSNSSASSQRTIMIALIATGGAIVIAGVLIFLFRKLGVRPSKSFKNRLDQNGGPAPLPTTTHRPPLAVPVQQQQQQQYAVYEYTSEKPLPVIDNHASSVVVGAGNAYPMQEMYNNGNGQPYYDQYGADQYAGDQYATNNQYAHNQQYAATYDQSSYVSHSNDPQYYSSHH